MVRRVLLACIALLVLARGATAIAAGAVITSPANGAVLSGSTQLFQWNAEPGAQLYQLWIGNSAGAYDLGYFPAAGTTSTSVGVDGLPTDGRTLYVTLWSLIGGTYQSSTATYAAASAGPAAALITSPANGATLTCPDQLFSWTNVPAAQFYQLWIGTSPGAADIHSYTLMFVSSAWVSGMPCDGRTLYVRLWTLLNGTTYVYSDSVYTAASPPAAAAITSPAPGSELRASQQTFVWSDTGSTTYTLWLGSGIGMSDIASVATSLSRTSTTIANLPSDGRTVYARLWTGTEGVGPYNDYTYTAASPAATIISPVDGATLTASSQQFQWSAVAGAVFQLWVGSTPGNHDLGYFPASATDADSITATGLPMDGRRLYVRLWTGANGTYFYRDTTYTAVSPASITNLVNGETLGGASQLFRWNDSGASSFLLQVGTTTGGSQIWSSSGGATSATVTNLPVDGSTIHVRLWSTIEGRAYFRDYTFIAAFVPPSPAPGSGIPSSLVIPADGTTLSGSTQTFQWNGTPGAMLYQLWLGNSVGAHDIGFYPASGTTSTIATVNGLPQDGRIVHARLWTMIDGRYYFRDFTYAAAAPGTPVAADMVSPAPGASLAGSSETFEWTTPPGATMYQIWVGNSIGGSDIGYFPASGATGNSTIASALPTDGRVVYVRLWSAIGGTYFFRDYAYRAASGDDPVLRPSDGTTIPGPAQAFNWWPSASPCSDATCVPDTITIGSVTGANDFGMMPGATGWATFTNLPMDGRTLHARLQWTRDGVARFRDHAFVAAPALPASAIVWPPNGSQIPGSATSLTVQWSPMAANYILAVGSTPGGFEYGGFNGMTFVSGWHWGYSFTVDLPPGWGPVVYVRLATSTDWGFLNFGTWYSRDYTFVRGP